MMHKRKLKRIFVYMMRGDGMMGFRFFCFFSYFHIMMINLIDGVFCLFFLPLALLVYMGITLFLFLIAKART